MKLNKFLNDVKNAHTNHQYDRLTGIKYLTIKLKEKNSTLEIEHVLLQMANATRTVHFLFKRPIYIDEVNDYLVFDRNNPFHHGAIFSMAKYMAVQLDEMRRADFPIIGYSVTLMHNSNKLVESLMFRIGHFIWSVECEGPEVSALTMEKRITRRFK